MLNTKDKILASAAGATGALTALLSLSRCSGNSCGSCYGCAGIGFGVMVITLIKKFKDGRNNHGMA